MRRATGPSPLAASIALEALRQGRRRIQDVVPQCEVGRRALTGRKRARLTPSRLDATMARTPVELSEKSKRRLMEQLEKERPPKAWRHVSLIGVWTASFLLPG